MRLLVLTHTFPPSRHANAKRPHYLVKGFLEAGWEVDVFTSRLGMNPGEGELVTHPNLRIYRRLDLTSRLNQRFAGNAPVHRAAVLTSVGLMWPDAFAFWSMRVLRESANTAQYDRVLAFILPASLLLSGVPSRWVGAHWTFDYQESVTPQYRRQLRRSPLQRMMLPVLAKLERRTLHKAGRVVFTADTNRQTYVRDGLAPETATAHVPYFFDAEVFRHPAQPDSRKFAVVYFGTFDWRGARSPEIFLRALAKFLERKPEARPTTSFLFHGPWLSEHDRFLDELKLRDVASIQPAVSYDEYLRKVKQSPILLLVVAAAHNLFMPSKIVDYFGARRPILAFVPRESEMRRVLEAAGMAEFTSDEFDVAGGAAALEHLWERHQANALTCSGEKAAFWSSEVQIPRYLELVRQANRPG